LSTAALVVHIKKTFHSISIRIFYFHIYYISLSAKPFNCWIVDRVVLVSIQHHHQECCSTEQTIFRRLGHPLLHNCSLFSIPIDCRIPNSDTSACHQMEANSTLFPSRSLLHPARTIYWSLITKTFKIVLIIICAPYLYLGPI